MRHCERIVVAPGVFDIIHYGHIRFLERAKRQGDYLIVSLLSNEAILGFKKNLPIISFRARQEVIYNLKMVDLVVRQEQFDVEPTLRLLFKLSFEPKVLVRSERNKSNHGMDYMRSIGGEVITIPYSHGISGEFIKEKIAKAQ